MEVLVELQGLAQARQNRGETSVEGHARVEPQERQVPRQQIERHAKPPARRLGRAGGSVGLRQEEEEGRGRKKEGEREREREGMVF